jgi:hypothetical protein
MSDTTAKHGDAQEAFDRVLQQAQDAVGVMRSRRKGHRGIHSTEELVAISRFGDMGQRNPTPPPEPFGRRRPSKVRIAVPEGATEFTSTLAVARRLSTLSDETEGEIICMLSTGQQGRCPECQKCQNLKDIWTRTGKTSPPIITGEALVTVLERLPIMVIIEDTDIEDGAIPGYHKVTLGETCFLLRRNGE